MARGLAVSVFTQAAALALTGCGDHDRAGKNDPRSSGANADLDADGVPNGVDDCPETKDVKQIDTDADGVGDACEPIPGFDPALEVTVYVPRATAPGIVLLSIMGVETISSPDFEGFGYLAAFPKDPSLLSGRIVPPLWVFSDSIGGPFSDVNIGPDGDLMAIRGVEGGDRAVGIDPSSGRTLWSYDSSMVNHGLQLLDDGTRLFIYSTLIENDTYGVDVDNDGVAEIRMDGVRVIDEKERIVWEWSLLDHDIDLSKPPSLPYAAFTSFWSGCNAVSFLPSSEWHRGSPLTGDIYLTCRLMDRIYKIAYPEGSIEWIMGRGGNFGDGFFHHPHDPQIEYIEDSRGNRTGTRILLYDNREAPILGDAEPCPPDESCPEGIRPYSRVIEVAVDEELRAELTWKWPSPSSPDFENVKVYSPLGGGIQKLPNGNLLITHGTAGGNPYLYDTVYARLDEVRRDGSLSGAEIVWSARLGSNYCTFKSMAVPASELAGWTSHVSLR